MSIDIYIKLEGDKATPLINRAELRQIKRNQAIKEIIQMTGCDDVLVSNSWGQITFHIGFKERQEDAKWMVKKPLEHGFYIHSPRSKTEERALLCRLAKDTNEFKDLSSIVKEEFKELDYETMGMGNTSTSFSLRRPGFGMSKDSNVIYGVIPPKEGLQIPTDFTEITGTEFNELNKAA